MRSCRKCSACNISQIKTTTYGAACAHCCLRVICASPKNADWSGHISTGWEQIRSLAFKINLQDFRLDISATRLHLKVTAELPQLKITHYWDVWTSPPIPPIRLSAVLTDQWKSPLHCVPSRPTALHRPQEPGLVLISHEPPLSAYRHNSASSKLALTVPKLAASLPLRVLECRAMYWENVGTGGGSCGLYLCIECSLADSSPVCGSGPKAPLFHAWIGLMSGAAKSCRSANSPTLHKCTHEFTRRESRHNTRRNLLLTHHSKKGFIIIHFHGCSLSS